MCNLYFIDGFYIFHVPLICFLARHVSIVQIIDSRVLACFPKIKHTSPYGAVGKCLTGSVCLSLMASTTVKMAGSECACEDSAEAQKSKNPLGIRK
jgi:hypothetical protein